MMFHSKNLSDQGAMDRQMGQNWSKTFIFYPGTIQGYYFFPGRVGDSDVGDIVMLVTL